MLHKKKSSPTLQDVGLQGLLFLLSQPEELGQFLAISGLGPENLRASAKEPAFLQAVLDYICNDEALLKAFSAHIDHLPQTVDQVRADHEHATTAWRGDA
jgi:hypothetical protein